MQQKGMGRLEGSWPWIFRRGVFELSALLVRTLLQIFRERTDCVFTYTFEKWGAMISNDK